MYRDNFRKTSKGNGIGDFFLCFFVNLIFNAEWLFFAAIALVLHFVFHLHIAFFLGILALWIIVTLAITLLLSFVSRSGGSVYPPKENVNPYSAKNSDYLPENKRDCQKNR